MMSMRVTQGKDYFDPSDGENFWRRRTGLEQKLIIVSSILFCLAFALMITTIVLDKRLGNYKSKSSDTTPGPTDSTLTTTISPTGNDTSTTTISPTGNDNSTATISPTGNDTSPTGNDNSTATISPTGNDTSPTGNDTSPTENDTSTVTTEEMPKINSTTSDNSTVVNNTLTENPEPPDS
ncbi:uncharacterized protein [Centruroides vittatus]|uniref:uncharacterized protein n=1 Tax=Centruroides vittatus TaxID=120091 RepID=UPI00350F2B2A